MKKSITLIIILFISISSCKKKYEKRYPEDTENTYLKPIERLTYKLWTLDSVLINNINITDSIFDSISYYRIYFDPARVSSSLNPNGVEYGYNEFDKFPNTQKFVWALVYNDDSIQASVDGYPYLKLQIPAYRNGDGLWSISKLENTKLILTSKYYYKKNYATEDSVIKTYFSKY